MTTNLIAYPFRLGPAGYVVVQPDDSEDYYAGELGILILTKPGERDLVPTYGMDDPTYDEIDVNELLLKVGLFGPPIRITGLSYEQVNSTAQDVIVEFEPIYQQNPDIDARS